MNYEVECRLCPENRRAKYIGETSRNLYTRMKEHIKGGQNDESFMTKHMEAYHDGKEADFIARVTHANRDCLTRQIREGVLIRKGEFNMNTKSEWHQPSLYSIHSEIIRE